MAEFSNKTAIEDAGLTVANLDHIVMSSGACAHVLGKL